MRQFVLLLDDEVPVNNNMETANEQNVQLVTRRRSGNEHAASALVQLQSLY